MAFGSLEGQTLGKYQVLAPLGAGGMARVYRAYHAPLDRYVAIKVLRGELVTEPEFLARFRREARAVAALRHPNIVQVFDFDVQAGLYYMVMELLEGDTLKARLLQRAGPLPLGEAGRVLVDALAGLGYAHGEGLIHRDLKPANLMLTQRGQVVLTDFGIAQIVAGPKQTLTGTLLGTLAYMAPEQGLRGECSPCSDLYALGVVLYELLTGRVPFEADTPLAILLKHANEPLPPPSALNPALPAPVEQVVLQALSKEPADRYASAEAMSAALQAALGAAGVALPERLPAAAPARLAPLVIAAAARDGVALDLVRRAEAPTEAEPAPRLAPPAPQPLAPRPVAPVIFWGLGALAAANLLALAVGGAFDRLPAFIARAWPAELLLIALGLSLLMEARAWRWFAIPVSMVGDVGVLLAGYALSGQWQRWFWWPLLVLIVPTQCVLALRWAGADPGRARRLGLAASITSAVLVVLDLLLALALAAHTS